MSEVIQTRGPLLLSIYSSTSPRAGYPAALYARADDDKPGDANLLVCDFDEADVEECLRDEQVANARLLCRAYNSYDKHCGARAVKCAEDDLLGQALEACKRILTAHDGPPGVGVGESMLCESHADLLRAVLAQAEGE